MNTGQMIDQLWKLNEIKKEAAKRAEEAEATYKAYLEQVTENLKKGDLRKASGKLANFSIKPSLVPTVNNWDLFYPYIYKNKAGYLLERRPSATACRELFTSKGVGLDADGNLTGSKIIASLSDKYGLTPFVKFTPHLTAAS